MKCEIIGCSNSRARGFTMFELTERRRKNLKWLEICKLPPTTPKYARICEGHFTIDKFEQINNLGNTKLKSTACPSILTPNPPRVLEQKAFGLYKLDGFDESGNHVFTPEAVMTTKTLPGFEIPSAVRVPLQCMASKENITVKKLQSTTPTKETVMEEMKSLLLRVESLEAEKRRLEATNATLQNDKSDLTMKIHNLEDSRSTYINNCDRLFNPDQKRLLELPDPSTNTRKWSPITLKKSIRIRLLAKAKGYEELRKGEGWPLPSLATINRRLKQLDFIPGCFKQMIHLLGNKVRNETQPHAKFAILSFDEMSLTPRIEFDKGLKMYVGFVSPQISKDEIGSSTIATHCLAVIVRGLTTHWKQLICYLLTGDSVDPVKLGVFIDNIISCLNDNGLIVVAVSSDMGGGNQAMWRAKGVQFGRYAVEPSVPHPCASDSISKILYCPDVPHLVKNTWAQLLRTTFLMPQEWVASQNAPARLVSIEHVKSFMTIQGSTGVRLVPNLKDCATEPSRFEKMRVPVALSFFNEKLGNAIILLANQGLIKKACLTTGYFILYFARWYKIMSSRETKTALYNNEKGINDISFLKEFIPVISKINFFRNSTGLFDRQQWKPIQSGIILATKVVINLWESFVATGILKYLLTSRLFSSGCENLFSQVRGCGDIHPPPVKLRHVLRLVSVAQYLRQSAQASYENDDEPYYIDFLDGKSIARSEDWVFDDEEVDEVLDMPHEELNSIVRLGLYYIAGWVVFGLKGACSNCDEAMISDIPLPELPSDFTTAVSQGGLSHHSYLVWSTVVYLEDLFIQKGKTLLFKKNVKEFLVACSFKKSGALFAGIKCHDLHSKESRKFLSLRVHILASDASTTVEKGVLYNSASAYMRTAAKNCKAPIDGATQGMTAASENFEPLCGVNSTTPTAPPRKTSLKRLLL